MTKLIKNSLIRSCNKTTTPNYPPPHHGRIVVVVVDCLPGSDEDEGDEGVEDGGQDQRDDVEQDDIGKEQDLIKSAKYFDFS